MHFLNISTKSPHHARFPEEVQGALQRGMTTALRMQINAAVAPLIRVQDTPMPTGELLIEASLTVVPHEDITALQDAVRRLARLDEATLLPEVRDLLTAARRLIAPSQPVSDRLPVENGGWDGSGFRPARVTEGGLTIVPVSPDEVRVDGPEVTLLHPVDVTLPGHTGRLTDVQLLLPDGRRAVFIGQARLSVANGEQVYVLTGGGQL